MSAWQFVLVVVAILLGALVKAITGVGLPLLAVPVIAAFTSIDDAVVVLAVPNLVANLQLVWRERNHLSANPDLPVLGLTGVLGDRRRLRPPRHWARPAGPAIAFDLDAMMVGRSVGEAGAFVSQGLDRLRARVQDAQCRVTVWGPATSGCPPRWHSPNPGSMCGSWVTTFRCPGPGSCRRPTRTRSDYEAALKMITMAGGVFGAVATSADLLAAL